jgi:HK97 family phage major capsid protein
MKFPAPCSLLPASRSLAFAFLAVAILAAALILSPAAALGLVALTPLLGITADPEVVKLLTEAGEQIKGIQASVAKSESQFGLIKEATDKIEKIEQSVDDFQRQFKLLRASQLAERKHLVRSTGVLTDDAAANLTAHILFNRLKSDVAQQSLGSKVKDLYLGVVSEITGLNVKTALSSSDIPLPVQYSGEVAELVSLYGAARRFGTVYPLGGSSVKLPRLKTDPTFSLIAGSGTVTEKSPQTEWVTFTPEKFGGLLRLPSELDADSIVAIGQFAARWGARGAAYCEDYQFFRATGAGSGLNGTAEGLCKNVVTNSKTVALASGDLSANDITLAKVRAMRPIVDAAALGMSAYYFHPSFEHKFSTFNTSGDKPYQANGLNGASLDGFPIRWVDAMPAFSSSDAASTVYGLFGDVSWHYLGLRGGLRFESSEQAAFTTDEILIRVLERMTTGLMATGAVAGIITAAS